MWNEAHPEWHYQYASFLRRDYERADDATRDLAESLTPGYAPRSAKIAARKAKAEAREARRGEKPARKRRPVS